MHDWSLTRSLELDGTTIRWDTLGEGSPVVLLHGTPSHSFLWRVVATRLAERYRVYIFDWPGYGTSSADPATNISWDEQARRLPRLFEHWGLERPAVVAHDIAPVFALRAHLLHGLDLGPLVIADAGLVPPFVTGFSRHVRDHVGVFRGIPAHIAEAMIERHLETTVHNPLSEEARAAYMAPWRGEAGVAAYWRAVAAYDEALARPAVARLGVIRSAVLVLWGAEDAWEPVWKADELAGLVPDGERRLLTGAGHFAPEDDPAGFADAVDDFLARHGHSGRR